MTQFSQTTQPQFTSTVEVVYEYGRTWRLEELPERSIALDGSVQGPAIDNPGRRYSFDHHAGCVRHSTLATTEQVLEALILGFDPKGFTVYVNDPDGDTTFSLWLLLHPERATEAKVQAMASAIGRIDAQGPSRGAVEKLHRCLSHGPKEEKTLELLQGDLQKVEAWYEGGDHALPQPFELPPAPAYVLDLATGEAKELGLVDDFVQAYAVGTVALLATEMKDGSVGYTIGKKSEFVDYDVSGVLKALNELEPGWGGGSTIGGAPRNPDGSRSWLTPEQVLEVMQRFVR